MVEKKQLTLADLAGAFAQKDPQYNYFHGKLFSFVVPDLDQFANYVAELNLTGQSFPNAHPATIMLGELAPIISAQIDIVLAVQDGQMQLHPRLLKAELPACNYLALVSPAEKKAADTAYGKAFESISFLKTFLALSFGNLSNYLWVADFDFDEKGAVLLTSPAIRMPRFGDLYRIIDATLAAEILTRLALQQDQFRARLQRASKFFDVAQNQKDEAFKFSSYWIALEILVGGTSDAIRTKLAASYGYRNKSFADDKLLFKEIEGIRHELFHKGQFGVLRSYQERLLQLYFWDLVIDRLGLKSRGLAAKFVESGQVAEEKQNTVQTPA